FTTASPGSPRKSPSLAGNIDGLISAILAAEGIVVGPVFFNPMKYGAVGNGATDDTAAFQACIDAAKLAVLAGLGGIVVIPPLKFKITSQLNCADAFGMRILGCGLRS